MVRWHEMRNRAAGIGVCLSYWALIGCGLGPAESPAEAQRSDEKAASDWVVHDGQEVWAPARQGLELWAGPLDARLQWLNPIPHGVGNSGGNSAVKMAEDGADHVSYGGVSTPLVADGRVFLHFTRSSGEVEWDMEDLKHPYFSESVRRALPESYRRVASDDVTIALDAETGELLWETVEPDSFLNFITDKRGHLGVTGTVGQGLVFSQGILGRVFAYDMKIGEKRWETMIELFHARALAVKEQFLAQKRMPQVGEQGHPFSYQRGGMNLIVGVLVIRNMGRGLIGLDPATGAEKWRVADQSHFIYHLRSS